MEVHGSLFIIGLLRVGLDPGYAFNLVFGLGHLNLVFRNRWSTPSFIDSIVVFECRCLSLVNEAFQGFLGRAVRSAVTTGRPMFTGVGRRGRVKINTWIGRWIRRPGHILGQGRIEITAVARSRRRLGGANEK